MRHLTIVGVTVVLFCATATRVEAQAVASSFEQLEVLVKPGDKITLVDSAGTEGEGRIGKLTPDTLTLLTATGPVELREADIAVIRQRRGDSLQNGAIIGGLTGAAYFVTALSLLADSDGGDLFVGAAIAHGALFAGLGAAAGVGIDAMIVRRQVIYQKAPGKNSIIIAPLFGRGRGGATVTVTF